MKRYIKSAVDKDISGLDYDHILDIADVTRDQDIIRELSKHERPYVRALIARNKNTPEAIRRELSYDPAAEVRQWVAVRTTDQDILARLSQDSDEAVRWAVAMCTLTPDDILHELTKDESSRVREAAEKNLREYSWIRNSRMRNG